MLPRGPERVARELTKVGKEGVTHKDVKNEGTSGDVHENTGDDDNVSSDKHGFIHENAPIEQ